MKGVFIAIFLSCFSLVLQAQDIARDSTDVERLDGDGRDSTTIVDNMFFDIFYGKPGRAALYGLVIPGGGQIYNRRWWKLPFVYGVEGGLIWWMYYSNKNYQMFQRDYKAKLKDPASSMTDLGVLRSNRDRFRKQREYSYVFFIGGHLITIFEAFIDRHLMDFDTSDDLTIGPISTGLGVFPGVSCTIPISSKRPKSAPTVE